MSSAVRPCALSLALLLSLPALAFSKPEAVADRADDFDAAMALRPKLAANSAVPRLVKFSGQLPLARTPNPANDSGTRLVTFSLYTQEQGGQPVWSETQVVNVDASGQYTVMLGSTILEGVPVEAFSSGEARWLGVTVEGEAEQVRMLLVSVPYALKAAEAEKLGGKSASDFVTKSDIQSAVQTAVQQSIAQISVASASGAQPSGGLDDSNHGNNALARVQPSVTQQGVTGAGATSFSDTSGNEVVFVNQSGTGMAVNAASTGTVAVNGQNSSGTGIAVHGTASSATGSAVGVRGDTSALNGQGVVGTATSLTGNTTGVQGQSTSATGTGVSGTASGASGVGVLGSASSPTGNTIGVEGTTLSPTGTAGVFNVAQSGATILSGQLNGAQKFSVDSQGNIVASGGLTISGPLNAPSFTPNFTGTNATQIINVMQSGTGTALVLNSTAGGAIISGRANGTEVFHLDGSASPQNRLLVTSNTPGITTASVTNPPPAAIFAEQTNATGFTVGVIGKADANNGSAGVVGIATGVATTDHATGVTALATATTGRQIGVDAQVSSSDPSASAGRFTNQGSTTGLVIEGEGPSTSTTCSNPPCNQTVFTVDASGNVMASGTLNAAHFVGDGSGLTGVGANGVFSFNNNTQAVSVTQAGTGAGIATTSNGTGPAIQAVANGGGTAGVFQSNATILQALNGTSSEVFRADQGGIAIGQGQSISNYLSATANLQFPQLAQASCSDLPVSVAAVADGDTIAIGVPSALATLPGVQYTGFVSAPGTVTVRACALLPVSAFPQAQVRVDVWKHSNASNGAPTGNQLIASPANVLFPSTAVGLSASTTVTLRNQASGTTPINIASIGAPTVNDFSVTSNTCGAQLAANATCTLAIAFAPAQAGLRAGSLTITDDAAGSPQTLSLSGNGSNSSLTITPAMANFGAVGVGSSASTNLTLSNNGASPIGFTFSGPNAPFSVSSNTCGSSVTSTCQIAIQFAPTISGPASSSITFTDNSGDPPLTVQLLASGGLPQAALSTTFLEFFNTTVGQTSFPQIVTLRNTGSAALQISGITIDPGFQQTNNCGTSVAAGANCTINVTSTPSQGSGSGLLKIMDNSNGVANSQQVSLSASGGFPSLTVNQSASFGTVPLNTASSPQQITVTNNGQAPLIITGISSNNPDFTVMANTCTTLVPSASCAVTIMFNPTVSNSDSGLLTFVSNSGGTPGTSSTASLFGTGGSSFANLNPGSLNFSSAVGVPTAPQTLILTNTGSAPLTLSNIGISGDFAQSNNCPATLSVNASCSFMVTFRPTLPGARTGMLTFTDNNQGTPNTVTSISLTGSGVLPHADFRADFLSFSSVSLSSTSKPLVVVLTNTGGSGLSITSISIPAPFAETDNCPISSAPLTPGASCTISVTFTPTVGGNFSASLSVVDNSDLSAGTTTQTPVTFSGSGGAALGVLQADQTSMTSTSFNPPTPSSPSIVTLTNEGQAPLNVTAISFTDPEFTQTNSCPGTSNTFTLSQGQSCQISVTYTPTAGSALATLVVTDDNHGVPGSTQILNFSGVVTPACSLSNCPAPITSFSQGSLGFSVAGQPQEETLTNTGGVPLTISSIGFSPATTEFAQTNDCPISPSTLAPGASCQIVVTFSFIPGTSTTGINLQVIDNSQNISPNSHNIPLFVGSATLPSASVCCDIGFQDTRLNTPSLPLQFIVTNNGGTGLAFSSIVSSDPQFTETDNCPIQPPPPAATIVPLAPGASCEVTVIYTPNVSGSANATMTVTDNSGGTAGSSQTVMLSGSSGSPNGLFNSCCSGETAFTVTAIGTPSTPIELSFKNFGNAPLNISGISITGNGFGIDTANSNCPNPGTLAPNQECFEIVTFTAPSSGPFSGTVTFTDNNGNVAGSTQSFQLLASAGLPSASVTSSVGFSTQTVGAASQPQTVFVTNFGVAPLIISNAVIAGSDFSILSNPCSAPLGHGQSCQITVVFTPSASGTRNGTITITDNDQGISGSTQIATLTGTGGSPFGQFFFPQDTTSFGNVPVGQTSSPIQVSFLNNGQAPLVISSISATTDFSVSSTNCPIGGGGLGVRDACTIYVTFTPSLTQFEQGTLTVVSNATNSPTSVGFNGTGF